MLGSTFYQRLIAIIRRIILKKRWWDLGFLVVQFSRIHFTLRWQLLTLYRVLGHELQWDYPDLVEDEGAGDQKEKADQL